jgi:hypothetical protein
MSLFYKSIPIDFFLKDLIQIESIQVELKSKLVAENAERIIMKFKNGIPYSEIEGNYEDIIIDFVNNNGVEVKCLTGKGDYDEFPISILNFGPLFWVEAQEFDSIQFFSTKEDAILCAELEYAEFL